MMDSLSSLLGWLLPTLLILLAVGLWGYTLWDVLKATTYRQGNRVMWMLLLFLAPGLGVLIYHAVGRVKG
jgi:hypothetical protein